MQDVNDTVINSDTACTGRDLIQVPLPAESRGEMLNACGRDGEPCRMSQEENVLIGPLSLASHMSLLRVTR